MNKNVEHLFSKMFRRLRKGKTEMINLGVGGWLAEFLLHVVHTVVNKLSTSFEEHKIFMQKFCDCDKS